MKKLIILFTCVTFLATTGSCATAKVSETPTTKSAEVRRSLINKYQLREYETIRLMPAISAYVNTKDKEQVTAEKQFALEFQKIVGKPFTGF